MNILIADDHSIVRTGLHYLVKNLADHVTVFEAKDFYQAKKIVKKNKLDLVLFDLSMPGVTDLSVISVLHDLIPTTPIIIISAVEDVNIIQQTIEQGAKGFIPKFYSYIEILKAIRDILGGKLIYPTHFNIYAHKINKIEEEFNFRIPTKRNRNESKPIFTKRQRSVLILLCEGKNNEAIAKNLGISVSTVKTHVVNVYKRLGVNSRAEAGFYARKMGLIRKEITDDVIDPNKEPEPN